MLLKEIFESWDDRHQYHLHNNEEAIREPVYALVNQSGQIARTQLSVNAAKALQVRPDLVKKFGKLFLRKIG